MYTKAYRKTEEYRKEVSFKELVKAIDNKWGHAYQPIKVEEDPIDNLLAEITEMQINKIMGT